MLPLNCFGVSVLITLINFALFSLSCRGSSPYKGLILAEILMLLGKRTMKSKDRGKKEKACRKEEKRR